MKSLGKYFPENRKHFRKVSVSTCNYYIVFSGKYKPKPESIHQSSIIQTLDAPKLDTKVFSGGFHIVVTQVQAEVYTVG